MFCSLHDSTHTEHSNKWAQASVACIQDEEKRFHLSVQAHRCDGFSVIAIPLILKERVNYLVKQCCSGPTAAIEVPNTYAEPRSTSRTLTFTRGSSVSQHTTITKNTGLTVSLCHVLHACKQSAHECLTSCLVHTFGAWHLSRRGVPQTPHRSARTPRKKPCSEVLNSRYHCFYWSCCLHSWSVVMDLCEVNRRGKELTLCVFYPYRTPANSQQASAMRLNTCSTCC